MKNKNFNQKELNNNNYDPRKKKTVKIILKKKNSITDPLDVFSF